MLNNPIQTGALKHRHISLAPSSTDANTAAYITGALPHPPTRQRLRHGFIMWHTKTQSLQGDAANILIQDSLCLELLPSPDEAH